MRELYFKRMYSRIRTLYASCRDDSRAEEADDE